MHRKRSGVAALSAALSITMSMSSFAAVIYAPGINGVTDNGESVVIGADSSSGNDSSSGSNSGYVVIGGGTSSTSVIQPGGPSSEWGSSSGPSEGGTVSEAPSGGSGVAVIGPGSGGSVIYPGGSPSSGSSPSSGAVLTTVDNTDITSCASNVTTDPIMGLVPFIHAQLLTTSGNLTEGFTTNMGAFNSPEDGFAGLKLRLENSIGDIYYRVYTNEHGWSKWAMNEMVTPYAGDGAKVTAVQIRGNGHTKNLYDFYYRIILNDGTVLGWAKNGESAGTIGTGKYAQQLQFALWPKGQTFGQSTDNRFLAENEEGVMTDASGVHYYSSWNGQPYTGWAYDTDNNKYYFRDSSIVTGWQYIDGYKYYFDASGRVVTDLEPIIGIQDDYIIKINKAMKTMTIYAKDGNNGYIMPVKVILNTIGPDTPIGTFKTYEKYRWKFMHDDIYCQFLLRFKDGFILHSIIYRPQPNSYCLEASTYNYLGKNQSDGCVRMTSGDAYWVYTHCGVGTQVTIYEDEWSTGPFDRPAIQQGIPFDQKYDPTDPVIVEQMAADAKAAAEAQAEAATGVEAPPTDIDN